MDFITLSDFYKSIFGCKTYKISLDAGCTCPNRDGTKGVGGCIFCSASGSGDFAAGGEKSVAAQVLEAKERIERKLRGRSGARSGKYVAYFQSFSSTYGNEDGLIEKYEAALSQEGVAGIAIATRPDCIGEKILSWLSEAAKRTFVQVELGLQTSSERTGVLINRLYSDDDYRAAVFRIKSIVPDVHLVTHLIFGLPGEDEACMMESVRFVRDVNAGFSGGESFSGRMFGIKITVLYVVLGTVLSEMYERGEFSCLTKEEYFSLLKKAVPLLGDKCVVHRLTGDPPKRLLVAPEWTSDKKRVMNELGAYIRG